jgi:hypothetical protein
MKSTSLNPVIEVDLRDMIQERIKNSEEIDDECK